MPPAAVQREEAVLSADKMFFISLVAEFRQWSLECSSFSISCFFGPLTLRVRQDKFLFHDIYLINLLLFTFQIKTLKCGRY